MHHHETQRKEAKNQTKLSRNCCQNSVEEETERKSENIAEQENKTAPGVLCCVWSSLHVELYWNADIIAG